MTDMRATERLLEVAYELACMTNPTKTTNEILAILAELRRRGDTLVRAADLRLVMENTSFYSMTKESQEWSESITRLENALGGKPR